MDKKQKHLKRFLAFVLSVAMTVVYMPSSLMAYADAGDGQPTQVTEEQQPETAASDDVSKADQPDADQADDGSSSDNGQEASGGKTNDASSSKTNDASSDKVNH